MKNNNLIRKQPKMKFTLVSKKTPENKVSDKNEAYCIHVRITLQINPFFQSETVHGYTDYY